MNFIYLRTSTEPIKVGDLTNQGIVEAAKNVILVGGIFYPQKNWHEIKKYIPMLIINAPEGLLEHIHDLKTNDSKARWKEILLTHKEVIPFHYQEYHQLWGWLQAKGITPEPEMLLEFDGEFEIKYERWSNAHDKWIEISKGMYDITYSELYRKVAIIKPTANEESEEKTFTKKEVIQLLVNERKRAVNIAYQFRDNHEKIWKDKKSAGNSLAFIEQNIAEECRYIGNAISGLNALSITLGKTVESLITEQINNTSK